MAHFAGNNPVCRSAPPRWQAEDAAIFLTWRLHGTLPYLVRTAARGMPVPPASAFAAFDRALDTAASGPKWLREPEIGQCVADAIRFAERQLNLYDLLAFCVMPNHVHLVVEPRAPVAQITHSIREFTGRAANRVLGRAGAPFWQDETFDHWIRSRDEADRLIHYTESNPVAAGLVRAAEEWPWSSASHALTARSPLAL